MKIKHLLREQAENAANRIAELQKVQVTLEKLAPHVKKLSHEKHYEFKAMETELNGLAELVNSTNLGDIVYDIDDAIKSAKEAINHANVLVYEIEKAMVQSIRRVTNDIEEIENDEEFERRFGDRVNESDEEVDEAKASRALCIGSKPDDQLGASQLASCKSQGFRARDGKKSHLVGKKRITVGGHKIKGKKYGGPLPDYGTRKDQR